jgi:hypothetical protein
VVRHGDVEGGGVQVLGTGRAADRAVVLGAAIGRADDQRLAQPIAQRLQPVERGRVDEQLAGLPVPRQAISAGLKLGQNQALSGTSRQWRWKVVVMRVLQKRKTRLGGGCGCADEWGWGAATGRHRRSSA